MDYGEAIGVLERSNEKFEFPVQWGIDLQSEHERYLTEKYAKKRVAGERRGALSTRWPTSPASPTCATPSLPKDTRQRAELMALKLQPASREPVCIKAFGRRARRVTNRIRSPR
jgi:hypothetical protein